MGLLWGLFQAWLLVVAFLAALFLFYGFHVKQRFLLRHIPGPKPRFLLGNWTKDYITTGYQGFTICPKIYGPVYKYFMGTEPRICVTDAELVHQMASKNFKVFHDRVVPPYLVPITKLQAIRLKWDMIWAKGKYWQSVRGSSEPLFSTKAFSSYQPIMNRIIGMTMDTVSKGLGEATELIDLFEPMNLQILGETIFGMDFGCMGEDMSKLGHSASYLMKPSSQGGVTWQTYLFMGSPALRVHLCNFLNKNGLGPVFSKAEKNNGYIFGAAKALLVSSRGNPSEDHYALGDNLSVKDKQEVLPGDKVSLEGIYEGISDYKGTIPGDQSFIARMLRSVQKEGPDKGKPLSDEQIASNAIGVILAGFETTSLGIAYTLYELAKDPASQQKCRDEVHAFYKEHGTDYELVYSDVEQFKYCDAAYHEGMRIAYPGIAPSLGVREALEDIYLGKWFIPKGSAVVMNVNGMFVDEKVFPDPMKFRPERFLKDNMVDGPSTRHPASHIPFGYGPRKCIGARLAVAESILSIVAIVKDFSFTLDAEHHPDPDATIPKRMGVTLTPIHGLWLKFQRLSTTENGVLNHKAENGVLNHKGENGISNGFSNHTAEH